MACVTGFDHDVFISYASEDNLATADRRGWVTLFEENLNALLQPSVSGKKKVDVWRDERLDSAASLPDTLAVKAARSAILVAVLSQKYLASDWCKNELTSFWSSRHLGFEPKLGTSYRVFLVVVSDQDDLRSRLRSNTGMPRELDEVKFTSFHDNAVLDVVKLAWPRGLRHEDQRFNTRLEKLAEDIARRLEEMRSMVDARPVFPPPPSDAFTIYLAEATDDLDDERRRLADDLRNAGVRVLPEEPLPNTRDAAEASIRHQLAQSRLVVHLLGDVYGRALIGKENHQSLSHLQFLLAREHELAHRGRVEMLVWVDETVNVDEIRTVAHREFLESVLREPLDVRRCTIGAFHESIEQRIPKRTKLPTAPRADRPLVYVTGRSDDLKLADTCSLVEYLKSECQVVPSVLPECDTMSPDESEDASRPSVPVELRRHVKYCANSDGVLLVYGDPGKTSGATAEWVQEKAFDVADFAKRRRKTPLVASVYDTPPPGKPRLVFSLDGISVIDGRNGFSPAILDTFLTQLRGTRRPR